MSVISINKGQIGLNNKNGWRPAKPTIRVAKKRNSPPQFYAKKVEILDKDGEVVAVLHQTMDGKALTKCGAKVILETIYDAREARD